MEATMSEEMMDARARELVLELGRRVYQVDLVSKEIEQIKAQILELNLKAYEMREQKRKEQIEQATGKVQE